MIGGVDVFIHKCNTIGGALVAVLSYVFGIHWILFAAFLTLNVLDYVTGCMKSHINGRISSSKGAKGIWKKIGYWLMLILAFGMVVVFEEIGSVIGVDLGITSLIGWFVLASLIINEIRSIIENFVEAGFQVPEIIVRGLEVANKVLDSNDQNDSA